MADYLVDTDVLVDHLRGAHELRPRKSDGLAYSVITRAELFAGRADAEQEVALLLDGLAELPVTRSSAEAAGRIRRTTGVRLPDALIAATVAVGYIARHIKINARRVDRCVYSAAY